MHGAVPHPTRLATLMLWACAGAARAGVTNGGFDQDGGSLIGWQIFNNAIGNVSAAELTPRSGTHVAKLYGGFNGQNNASGVFQSLPALPNQYWRARTFARHNAGDSLLGTPNYVVLKIEFYSVAGGAHGSPQMLQETGLTVLTAASVVDEWLSTTLMMRAPPGTVEARVSVVFVQRDEMGGAALIDDVSFEPVSNPWTLVWYDEFTAPGVDATKWNIVDGATGGNNELNWYAPDEVYAENGNLVLRSRPRSYNGKPYTSGQVNTWARFSPTYGRIDVRAKLPWGRGLWPAHWLLPQAGGWPPEIDIMELIGSNPWCVRMSQHWGPLPPGVKPWDIGQTAGGDYCGPDFTADYHTYSVEWWPGQVHWLIDGVLRVSSIRSQAPAEPMFLILNTAVGGDWPGPPDGSTPWPAYHLIDYVRVYVPTDSGDALASITDVDTRWALVDGVIGTNEYPRSTLGINAGIGDRIGASSRLYVDSGGDGKVRFGFRSHNAWPTTGSWGAVIYIDSQYGGFSTTQVLADAADTSRRCASGKGASGQRADLYFPLGFTAEHAIVCRANEVAIYELNEAAHTFVNGAALGAAYDALGGDAVRYRMDDGVAGLKERELELRLVDVGVTPGRSFNCFVTMLNGDTAFRSNEFMGVAPGSAFDAGNIGASTAVLKTGDFVRFTSVAKFGDYDADGDLDESDVLVLGDCLEGPGTAPLAGGGSGACVLAFDTNWDLDVDLADVAALQRLASE